MTIDLVEIRKLVLPLVAPFTTSFGTQTQREVLIVRVERDGVTGWGECVTLADPVYSPEYTDGAHEVMRRYLLPLLLGKDVDAQGVRPALHGIVGNRMARAALEMAVLDAELRQSGKSFASWLGVQRDRVPSGVSVGVMPSIPELLETVGGYLDAGYQRIKLKIKPGWDVEPVAAVREAFGRDVALQVDANTAYTLGDWQRLARLDEFDLLLIEQPLGEEDLRQHAELAKRVRTPICLDESIVSVEAAADAIALGSTSVINVKPGRVGGYLEARRIHDLCRANGIPVWCGGMLETGIGRAANAAFAGLPGFTLVGDISGSDRFYEQDITAPHVLEDGSIRIPTGPGFGVEPIPEILEARTVSVATYAA